MLPPEQQRKLFHAEFHRALISAVRSMPSNLISLTCGVETKEQRAGNGESQDPDDGDHHKNSFPGAMGGVVQDRHHHGRVPADRLQVTVCSRSAEAVQ